jgi:SsrA-binding protein
MAKKQKASPGNIGVNKKAKFDYFIEDKFEAGVSLLGWEVKSLREGKLQLADSYVVFQNHEALLVGVHISPLNSACTHVVAEPMRTRKLLLNRREIDKLERAYQADGMTILCTALYWKGRNIKAEVCIGKGKKEHDKRQVAKERDWNKQKESLMKHRV